MKTGQIMMIMRKNLIGRNNKMEEMPTLSAHLRDRILKVCGVNQETRIKNKRIPQNELDVVIKSFVISAILQKLQRDEERPNLARSKFLKMPMPEETKNRNTSFVALSDEGKGNSESDEEWKIKENKKEKLRKQTKT